MKTETANDPFNLSRFVHAQQGVYETALRELKNGRKETHWMWFIFPQIAGLGTSPTARHYAIQNAGEAAAYLSHPVLGPRLEECCHALLDLKSNSANEIFGSPDNMKLRSSMTLFSQASQGNHLFKQVLEKFFHGEKDGRTLEILGGK